MSFSSSSSSPSVQHICPNGSKFFACTTGTKFIGCCATTLNPCNPSCGCAPPNLKAASFPADAYGTFPDQECPAGSLWYTCKETRPPFWGCCSVNACAETGCVGGVEANLSAAFLSSNPSVAAAFLSMVGSSYSISTSTMAGTSASSVAATAKTTTTTTTIAASPTTTTTSSLSSKNTTSNIGAIVGGTVAGVAIVLAFILALLFLYRRPKAGGGGGGGSNGAITMSTIPHQQSPLSMHYINLNTHPALRKPEISPVAAVEEQGSRQPIPNMGESQIEAYGPQKYRQTLPPPAFPIHNHLNRNPPIRPPPPRSPSHITSKIDGTPVFTSSPAPPASKTFSAAPPVQVYSACSGLASSERGTRAELEGGSPTKPAGGREMEGKNKGKRMMMMSAK